MTKIDCTAADDPWVDESKQAGGEIAHDCPQTRANPSNRVAAKVDDINVTILALDLANHCGWALRRRDGRILHGTENFTPRDSWTPGQRWARFRAWLAGVIVEHQVTDIAFELVMQMHSSASASDVYGGFKALVELAADSHRLNLHWAHVATIKKHFTGDGRAKKQQMIEEARRRGFRPADDNAADALAILHWAVAKEAGTWKAAPKRPKAKPAGKGMRRPPARVATAELFGAA